MSLQKDGVQKDYADVEATLTRITSHTGVQGIVIATHEGSVIRSTLDNIQTQQISTLVTQLAARGKSVVRDLDPEDDLTFLRIRSKKNEIMVAETKQYLLITIQNPNELQKGWI
ncbi:Dynein light chain roadblock-type 2 [Geranomyces variabilis]|uniref:Dynein light chain roadblock n=1 Tax=Geranomyces variabilis TaxID=109894 RepID=A0AAD5TRM7_9FUNG|nr:Dynein light chain roadblock-type 2 [Geranomyces variabilis]